MKKPFSKQIINIQAYKHDGKLYRQYNGAQVIEVTDNEIVVLLFKSKVMGLDGERWVVREPQIWWFPLNDFWNVNATVRKNTINYYVNIASPPVFEDNTLKYIDYDLDIRSTSSIVGKYKVYDQKDFKENKVGMEYGEKLITKIEESLDEVVEQIKSGEGIFDHDYAMTYVDELVENKSITDKKLQTNTK